jgi:acyl dehydratase
MPDPVIDGSRKNGDQAPLADQVLALGHQCIVAREPVNATQIRQFCDAIGEDNPIYRDDRAARGHGHRGQVAPPAMLHSWTIPSLRPGGADLPLLARARALFNAGGFPAVVATNYALHHDRYFAVGERIVETITIEGVSACKHTPLGSGHFLSTRHDFAADGDAPAATLRLRVFHFRPGEVVARTPAPEPVPPAADAIVLADRVVDITPTLIVAGAIGSNDYERVHHDVALAQAQGLQNIIMNILTTTGLVCRHVTDWAGAGAMLHDIALRLKAPNYPGDRMTLAGFARDGVVSVIGRNGLGVHVEADVAFGG